MSAFLYPPCKIKRSKMHCEAVFRVSSLSVIKLFFLFELFRSTACKSSVNLQSDFRNQEVADFQNFFEEKLSYQGPHSDIVNLEVADFQKFLEEKLSNQGHQENVLHRQQDGNLPPSSSEYLEESEESEDVSYEDVQEPTAPRSNEEPQLTSAENVPKLNPLHKSVDSSGERDLLLQNDGGAQEVEGEKRKRIKDPSHHPVEIVVIRESDSKLKDSLGDILKKVLSPNEPSDKSSESKDPNPISKRSLSDSDSKDRLSGIFVKALAPKEPTEPNHVPRRSSSLPPLRPDTCSASNHTFYDRQTCSSGYEYKLEPHLSATFSEDLKAQMLLKAKEEGIYPPPKMPRCGFNRHMRSNKDVTIRSLCPFQWEISERNPSRIPEYLYVAKCAECKGCTELKSKIPVLWRVGCEDKQHVYREGWEEKAVACVPTVPPIIGNEEAYRVKVTTPHN